MWSVSRKPRGNLVQVSNILEQCGPDVLLFSGDDFTLLPSLSLGACGVISVTSNILPAKVAALCEAWEKGDTALARKLHFELEPMNRAMFAESNPIPVKTALSLMGRMTDEFRLPLCNMAPARAGSPSGGTGAGRSAVTFFSEPAWILHPV